MKTTKTIFIKKTIILASLFLMPLIGTSFVPKNITPINNKLIVYGIVYTKRCSSSEYTYYTWKLANDFDYQKISNEMKESLKSRYPDAVEIKVGTSSFDYSYSNTATNMCVIKWERKNTNCSYWVISFSWGKSQSEALNKAMEKKNLYGGKDVKYEIVEEHYWSEPQPLVITDDFGGVTGKFYVLSESLACFLTNTTKDKLATIVIETPDGKKIVQNLEPGGTWQTKIDTKKIKIGVSYQDYKEPIPEFNFVEFGKKVLKQYSISNENGKVKSEPTPASVIRG